MHAASAGSLAALEKLLERKDASVSHVALDGRDAMFVAIEHDHSAIACLLRNAGAEVNRAGPKGKTPIHIAASRSTGITNWLLSEGAFPDCRTSDGREPLSLAAEAGKTDSVLLLKQGAKVDAFDDNGNTALHYSAGNGHLETTRLLCIAGAARDMRNVEGNTPGDLARAQNYQELAAELASDMRSVWLVDPNPDTRWRVAEWIGQVGTSLKVSHLEALLKALQSAQEIRKKQEDEIADLDML